MAMKFRDRVESVRQIPAQVTQAVNTTIAALVVAIFAFLMSAIALIGVRHAH